jgi:hypothetical protein
MRTERAWALGVAAWVCIAPAGALARGGDDDPDRQQRRLELRQQLQAEGERWRAQRPLTPYGPGAPMPFGHTPAAGHGMAPGFAPPPGAAPGEGMPSGRGHGGYGPAHGGPGAYGPYGAPGGAGGWGGHRMSPEERRELRQELRRQSR